MLTSNQRKYRKASGFSLIEMAVVLLIISALLGGLLVSVGTTREVGNRNSTEDALQDIVDALYGFAQANDRLPCPATAASNGFSAPAAAGPCSVGTTFTAGFVPSGTLGLSGRLNVNNLLSDAWGNPYRYVVTNAAASAFTSANMGSETVANLATQANLQICDSASCAAVVANNLPAVVLSMGANWAAFTGADEVENSGEITVAGYRMPNNLDFVTSGYVEDVFDDMLNWVSPNLLVSKMIAAGQLP
ncbi:MAG: prepilin-type N-terminal cleavage/methylation domain-containing protein [Pseudohongiellaceae bacterium]